ncbi:hypothetical protein ACNRWW_09800 [Metabacillus sp. HB246100]|uniref:hypothetical protein n=1 Tax=Bacillus weihaiensis TaxID=1547283 RepID=UPI002357D445|nr:hypothetical protein [Bacillus weihaiensis]
MYDAFQLGPFTIQYFILVSVLTFLFTYFILDVFSKDHHLNVFLKKHYWTFVFLIFISYKFSVVLFRPELLLSTNWIFLTGGIRGVYVGLFLILIYLVWIVWVKNESLKNVLLYITVITCLFAVLFQLNKIVILSLVQEVLQI